MALLPSTTPLSTAGVMAAAWTVVIFVYKGDGYLNGTGRASGQRPVGLRPFRRGEQDDIDAGENESELCASELTDTLDEGIAVERNKVGNVDDGVLGKSGNLRGVECVTWGVGPAKVAGQHDAEDSCDAASI